MIFHLTMALTDLQVQVDDDLARGLCPLHDGHLVWYRDSPPGKIVVSSLFPASWSDEVLTGYFSREAAKRPLGGQTRALIGAIVHRPLS